MNNNVFGPITDLLSLSRLFVIVVKIGGILARARGVTATLRHPFPKHIGMEMERESKYFDDFTDHKFQTS